MINRTYAIILTVVMLWCTNIIVQAASQDENIRVYTKENPLVYEDVFDLWPYSFLNENGEPDGYNVELVHMMLKELDIPYVIRMKPKQECFQDLRDGKSDLMFGLAAGFNDGFGRYSSNIITLFTQDFP